MKEHEINIRIRDKIDKSDLDKSVKDFLYNVLEIEKRHGKGSSYSKLYEMEIAKCHLLMNKNRKWTSNSACYY